ncbi:MAG: DUF721 domain-containing protein [Myxococcales bacterium]|nr:DUF721 domain-containing protein [Myxococcota bacterium]MDW8282005.1 DUF721 domain-containing protein [Myxococcales bacterium]
MSSPSATVTRGRRLQPARRRKHAMPLSGLPLVEEALRRLDLLEEVRALRALRAYALACGPHLLQSTRAERFRDGVLYIRAESSAWANELALVRDQLLRQIHAVPGGQEVRSLRFCVGPVRELPTWLETKPEPPPATPVPCDPSVGAALSRVRDPQLREALAALYVRACRAGRR